MNIDERIAEYKADIKKWECVYKASAIGSIREAAKENAEDRRQMVKWLEELKQLREQVSDSEKPNKWISTSEAMPIIGQDVLVCDLDGNMYITSLHLDDRWGFDYCGNKIKNVVAWQELPPAPFKPQESEE